MLYMFTMDKHIYTYVKPCIFEDVMEFTDTFVYDIETIRGVCCVYSLDENDVDRNNLWKVNLHSNKHHYDDIKRKNFPRYWPLVRGVHR